MCALGSLSPPALRAPLSMGSRGQGSAKGSLRGNFWGLTSWGPCRAAPPFSSAGSQHEFLMQPPWQGSRIPQELGMSQMSGTHQMERLAAHMAMIEVASPAQSLQKDQALGSARRPLECRLTSSLKANLSPDPCSPRSCWLLGGPGCRQSPWRPTLVNLSPKAECHQ